MRKKEAFKVIIFFIILVVGIGGFLVFKAMQQKQEPSEIVPEEEISQEQERQTMITLYFKKKGEDDIGVEVRKVDSKKLLQQPCEYLLEELVNGTTKTELENIIPEGTKINNVNLEKGIVNIDLSKEFIEKSNKEGRDMAIESILKTMKELNEVNGIKIIIDGNENNKENDLENVYN